MLSSPEEHLGVMAVGDRGNAGDGVAREIDGGEITGEEDRQAGSCCPEDVESGSVGYGRGDATWGQAHSR